MWVAFEARHFRANLPTEKLKKQGFATAVREVIGNTKLGRILRYLATYVKLQFRITGK
jgi:hypothetical protein